MGAGSQNDVFANQTSFKYTSTRSIFALNIDDLLEVKVTFLSPVTPDDLLRSSLPYSYMKVGVRSLHDDAHEVQLYTDISGEWVSGDRSAIAEWEYGVIRKEPEPQRFGPAPSPTWPASSPPTTYGTKTSYSLQTCVAHPFQPFTKVQAKIPMSPAPTGEILSRRQDSVTEQAGGVAYHKFWRQQQLEFSEFHDQAEWGYWYYATNNSESLTYQSGSDGDVRSQFITNGMLSTMTIRSSALPLTWEP